MATLYHCSEVPFALRSAMVAPLQNVCAEAVGTGVVVMVTATYVLMLSQEFKVCET